MSPRPLYEALADAFRAEGVDTAFVLTGNGNMHWDAAFAALDGARSIHVRHEHCACAMALAHGAARGRIGVASVTCGPGLTQIMTALTTAAKARMPLVVFAGEGPLDTPWYHQSVDQEVLVKATGAAYIAVHTAAIAMRSVGRAFALARSERRPVVIGVPLDLQQVVGEFTPMLSAGMLPDPGPRAPRPDALRAAAERIRAARRIVLLAGRGVVAAGARAACERLADQVDAALATTLPARGAFAGHPRHIGVSGGYAHEAARVVFDESDLVLAVGTSLTPFTSDRHALFNPQDVVLINDDPDVDMHGQTPPALLLCADAKLAVEALTEALEGEARVPAWDVAAHAHRVRTQPADTFPFETAEGELDPRAVISALDDLLPKDWSVTTGSGHYIYFTMHMQGREADNYLAIPEYGAIGNGLSYAIGMALAHPDRPLVLFEGDGGMMMHAQELETIRRYGVKLLICVLNDGAYGAEIHRLRASGLSDKGTIYGRDQIAAIARGYGLRAASVRSLDQLPDLYRTYMEGDAAMLWDIQISDRVLSPTTRRATGMR